jgi:hypothetical protein
MNLKITPAIGGFLTANQLFVQTDASGSATMTRDYYGVYHAEPYLKLDTSMGLGSFLYLTTSLRGGRYLLALDGLRTPLYDASAELNLSTLLSFFDAWPLHDTSLRTYGRADYLVDGSLNYKNFMYTAVQEFTITILKGGNPYSTLALTPAITWQDSTLAPAQEEPWLYYSPRGILIAGGSVTGSTWIGVGGGSVLGLSLRGFAGSYEQYLLDPGLTISRAKFEAELNANLTRGATTWGMTAMVTATYNPSLASPWDYWSAFVRVSCTVNLPEVLAP